MKIRNLLVTSMLILALPALAQNAPNAPAAGRSMTQPQPDDLGKIPNAPPLPYHFGKKVVAPNGEKFGNVASVAMMPNGDLLVFNRNPAIMMVQYDPTGTTVKRVFNPNIAINPHAMRVDSHGNIWIIDSFLNVIFKLDPQGNVIRVFGTRGENAAWDDTKWNGMFNQPLDISFDKDDNFYVVQSHGGTSPPADCTFCVTYASPDGSAPRGAHAAAAHPAVPPGSDPRVMKFDKTGKFLASASLAHADGLYPTMHTVMVTPTGDVWAGDRHSRKIIIFDKDLKNRREMAVDLMPCGFFTDAKGQLWMSTGRDGMVAKMGWDGKVQGWIGKRGTGENDTGEGHFMAVSADQKTLWLADSVSAQVLKMEHD